MLLKPVFSQGLITNPVHLVGAAMCAMILKQLDKSIEIKMYSLCDRLIYFLVILNQDFNIENILVNGIEKM